VFVTADQASQTIVEVLVELIIPCYVVPFGQRNNILDVNIYKLMGRKGSRTSEVFHDKFA